MRLLPKLHVKVTCECNRGLRYAWGNVMLSLLFVTCNPPYFEQIGRCRSHRMPLSIQNVVVCHEPARASPTYSPPILLYYFSSTLTSPTLSPAACCPRSLCVLSVLFVLVKGEAQFTARVCDERATKRYDSIQVSLSPSAV